jgi:hypothetical protein
VTEIMNPLKQRYRFIDLLKPENEAVIPILVALEPAVVREIRKLLPLQMKSHTGQPGPGRVLERQGYIKAGVLGQVPEDQARISAGSGVDARQFPGSLPDFPATALEMAFNEEALQPSEYTVEEGEALLEALKQSQAPGRVPPEQAQIGAKAGAWLQSAFSLWRMRRARPGPRLQHLHDAWVAQRQAIATRFDLSIEDPIYFTAAKRLAGGQLRVRERNSPGS